MEVLDASNKFLWGKATRELLRVSLTPAISHLDLSTDHVEEPENSEESSADLIISAMTSSESSLTSLILSQCRMQVRTTMKIIESLPRSHIAYLSLDQNVITVEVCEALAKAFEADPPLEYLSMRNCDLPADGCVAIAQALPKATRLKTLVLDANCIFDKGCEAIAKCIAETNIQQLSIANNQIWMPGTSALLKALTGNKNIVALDLSYNIIDLTVLIQYMRSTPNLKCLSISGCKVNESLVLIFLEELGRTQLTTFIIEGLNYNQLPISWPHSPDTLWTNRTNFEALIRALRSAQSLTDLRFGFLDIKQIKSFVNLYQTNQMSREISISISDFGRTGNNWVATFPNFKLEAPLSTLKWGARIYTDEAQFFGTMFTAATFDGKPLDSLDISNTSMTDDILKKLLEGFDNIQLKLLDLSNNDFGDVSAETITPFFNHSQVESLILTKTNLTEFGFQRFFRFFVKYHPDKVPKVLKFSFNTQDNSETATHQFFTDLSSLIGADSPLEELEIRGNVTTNDLMPIFKELINNSHLKTISIPEVPQKYQASDPKIEPEIQENFNNLVRELYNSVTDSSSKCVLSKLTYPLLTTVFLFSDEILSIWGELETKFEQNKLEQDF